MKGFICPHVTWVHGHVEEPATPVVRYGFRATLFRELTEYASSSKLDNTLTLIHIVVCTRLFVEAQQVVVVCMLGVTDVRVLINEL